MASFLYRVLLLAYPASLRRAHGEEMTRAFADQWHAASGLRPRVRLLCLLATDFVVSLASAWREAAAPAGRLSTHPSRSLPMPALSTDLRLALRVFRKAPLFAFGAVVTLALGIGATSAVFSLADATLLHPLPVAQPDRLLQVDFSWSAPDVRALEQDHPGFSSVAAWANIDVGLDEQGRVEPVHAAAVSGGYFQFAGLGAEAGRLLDGRDDRPGAPPAVVVSERLWRGAYGRDPGLVGRTVRINERPATVVGVAASGFRGFSLRDSPDVFVPLAALEQLATGFLARPALMTNQHIVWLQVAGRLDPGTTPEAGRQAIERLYGRQHPPAPDATTPPEPITLVPLTAQALGLTSAEDLRRFIGILAAATLVTLLLTCASVAGLMLVRTQARQRELAVRMALGASRLRLARLLFMESLAIGLMGAVAGLLVAYLTFSLLQTFSLPGDIPIADLGLALSRRVLALSAGAGVATSLLFGLTPMWQAARVSPRAAIGDGARVSSSRSWRPALVAIQVAISVVLLGGGLAFGRAIQHAFRTDFGFDTARTLVVTINPALARYPRDRDIDFQKQTLVALAGRPEIGAAGWATMLPLRGSMQWEVAVPGRVPPSGEEPSVETNVVSPGYFQAMATPLVAGRDFRTSDGPGVERVAVVSRSMARRYWGDADPIGRQLSTDLALKDPDQLMTVIGVVEDIQRGMDGRRGAMMYLPILQQPDMLDFGDQHLFVRASRDVATASRAAVDVLAAVDPRMPVVKVQTMRSLLATTLMAQQLGVTLFSLFAGLALLLTGLGLYAVVAYAVSDRTREIGIRVALGARSAGIVGLVARQGLVPVGVGLAAGAAGLLAGARALDQFMFDLPAVQTGTIAVLIFSVTALAVVAMVVPARRALRIDAARALRSE
jgi:putative ABC transport system permease protein